MKRIYIAGPYSADNVMDVLHNIRAGIQASYDVFKAGYAPFCPWLDYHYVLFDKASRLTINDFYDYSIAWLRVSDALLVIGDYKTSKGTLAEIDEAGEIGIPVFYNLSKLLSTIDKSD